MFSVRLADIQRSSEEYAKVEQIALESVYDQTPLKKMVPRLILKDDDFMSLPTLSPVGEEDNEAIRVTLDLCNVTTLTNKVPALNVMIGSRPLSYSVVGPSNSIWEAFESLDCLYGELLVSMGDDQRTMVKKMEQMAEEVFAVELTQSSLQEGFEALDHCVESVVSEWSEEVMVLYNRLTDTSTPRSSIGTPIGGFRDCCGPAQEGKHSTIWTWSSSRRHSAPSSTCSSTCFEEGR
jgi:hypothetical protein